MAHYEPLVARELRWLVPIAALAWIVISSLGRKPCLEDAWSLECAFGRWSMMALQAAWLALFGARVLGLVPLSELGGGNAYFSARASRT